MERVDADRVQFFLVEKVQQMLNCVDVAEGP